MAARRKQSPLVWIIEAFSVFTAAGFVLSGIGNGLVFWLGWKLNYFMIASPSDVVMSGFLVVGLSLILVSLIAGLLACGTRLVKWFKNTRAKRAQTEDDARRIGLANEGDAPTSKTDERRDSKFRWIRIGSWANLVAALGAIVGVTASIIDVSSGLRVLWSRPLVAEPRPTGHREQFGYRTGLKLAPSALADQDCRGAPVLWMGSSAAIVGCERGVRVFHKLDDLVTEPLRVKRDPKEYLPPVQVAHSKIAANAPPCRDGKPECDP